jgi:hypothetical protein
VIYLGILKKEEVNMLDYSKVYNDASNREKKVLIKLEGDTLDLQNMIVQTTKLSLNELERLQDIVDLYTSINQKSGIIEVLDKALIKTLHYRYNR